MKSKSKFFIVSLAVYPFDCLVSLGKTDAELEVQLKKYGIDYKDAEWEFEDLGKGKTVRFSGGQLLIRYDTIPKTSEDYGFLQHEIFHAVHFLMHTVKTPLNLDTCEAYAYLTGYLTTEIYKKL